MDGWPMSISLNGSVGRGDFERALNFSVADGEVLAITGPNGSGKSTIIHTIAGLVPLRSGYSESDDAVWDAPEHRTCAVVFQDLRLFPNMNVIANVSYGLRARGIQKDEAIERSQKFLTRVGLTSFEKRQPADLSGGERQRAALRELLPEVLGSFAGSAILVTHDLGDVEAIGSSYLRLWLRPQMFTL
jgi:ABC-type Fe3+/spermidine/putrescine transport system ATPase subunit